MAALNNTNQQAKQQPQDQVVVLSQAAGYGHAPQEQVTFTQYPPPPVICYLPQGYPPRYPKVDQAPGASNYPQQFANASSVVVTQPTPATSTYLSPPEKNYSRLAITAFVFSLCTLICGGSLICLTIPAFVLSIVAIGNKGSRQKETAILSIGLNIAVIVCTVVLLVAVVTPVAVTTSAASSVRYCPSYYSSSYSTYCVPYSYYTSGSCGYYASYNSGYCPSSSTPYRTCPSYYSSSYSTYCTASSYSTQGSCTYSGSGGGYCPSSSSPYRYCSSYYSSSYSTYCTAYRYYTQGSCYYSGATTAYCPT